MELLIVILIITLLAAMALAALQGATEEARAERTRAVIAKLDQLIMDRWDGYKTRTLPIRIMPGTRPKSEPFTDSNGNGFWNSGEPEQNGNGVGERGAAFFRLMALRELMRMELPDRRTDVINTTTGGIEGTATPGMTNAALQRSYYRKVWLATSGAPLNWSESHQGSECLYLIVSSMHDGDKNALDFFTPSEIGDVDEDGMHEILDGWGNPVEFLRWAPGFRNDPGPDGGWGINDTDDNGDGVVDDFGELGAAGSDDFVRLTMQRPDLPDPYDPVDEDARATFALRPLIFSAGRDKLYDVTTEGGLRYAFPDSPPFPAAGARSPNDPYFTSTSGTQAGMVGDANGDGYLSFADNITNHYQEPN